MGCQDEFKAMLKERGFRLTPQREIVLDVLHDMAGHVTAEEIHADVQAIASAVDISTVYRTLELLQELGLVAGSDLGDGQMRYELLTQQGPHHHMQCVACGRTVRIETAEIQPALDALAQRHGFAIQAQHLVITGLCPRCREKRAHQPVQPV